MITQTPEQQRLCEARLKFQMDEAARIEQALNEGRVEGRREGVLQMVATLQELLGIVDPTPSALLGHTESQLQELAERLKLQLRDRGLPTG